MNTTTMEGLVGGSTSANLMTTPMQVYEGARRRGDTATMERSLKYAGELADEAEEYQTKTDKGMKEDAKQAKEKEKLEREKLIQKRREEHKKLEEKIDENESTKENTDIAEISEEGKAELKASMDLDNEGIQETKTDAVKESVVYTKTGEVIQTEQSADISIYA